MKKILKLIEANWLIIITILLGLVVIHKIQIGRIWLRAMEGGLQ